MYLQVTEDIPVVEAVGMIFTNYGRRRKQLDSLLHTILYSMVVVLLFRSSKGM
jgi:hypothetical protein